MRLPLLLLPVLAAGCVYPNYKASKVVEFTIPAGNLQTIDCQSHNGDITVNGDPAVTEIALRAEMSVRGYSQAEADANLHLLEVGREETAGLLKIWGKYPSGELNNRSPGFRFTMKVPQRLALQLVSHNGDLNVQGTEGTARFETHNGDIGGSLQTNQVVATTHNGDVVLKLAGAGALDGEVTSHNGDIELTLAEGFGTRLAASTHNGRVTPPARIAEASVGKRSLAGSLGDGKGRLVVESHNGNVTFR